MSRLRLVGGDALPVPFTVEAARLTSTREDVTLGRVSVVRSPITLTLWVKPVSLSLTRI